MQVFVHEAPGLFLDGSDVAGHSGCAGQCLQSTGHVQHLSPAQTLEVLKPRILCCRTISHVILVFSLCLSISVVKVSQSTVDTTLVEVQLFTCSYLHTTLVTCFH